MSTHTVLIAAGCSVDVTVALPQIARYGKANYVVIDYMYEGSIAAMASELNSHPQLGFAADFAAGELQQELERLLAAGTRIITNAGGLNPLGCAAAVRALADKLGLKPVIAVVHGDNILAQIPALRAVGYRDMYTGDVLPEGLIGANAYLGAKPIAAALERGADIVITGRVVDSALTLGPLIHEFGWAMSDYERLGAGTLTGHLLECGAHPTGGIFTDWRDIDWSRTSFPLAECHADGTAVLTSVDGGGVVNIGTVSEQILYEITDPQRYIMADVTCDLTGVQLKQQGPNRVTISGGTGRPPTECYKVCAIAQEGWRAVVSGVISGPASREKAEKTANAIIERTRDLLRGKNWADFQSATYELIGSGESNGARALPFDFREMVYRIVVDHDEKDAVELMLRVSSAAMASMAPGSAGTLGRSVAPKLRQYSFLIEKDKVPVKLTINGVTEIIEVSSTGGFDPARLTSPATMPAVEGQQLTLTVPLERLAWTRSGDKGDISNVGIIARKPDYVPYLVSALTERAVKDWYAHIFAAGGRVTRYELPTLNALNFVMEGALDGGVAVSRRFDAMGKGLGQQIVDFPVPVTSAIAAHVEQGFNRRTIAPRSVEALSR